MALPKLVEYIDLSLSKGFSEEQIIEKLKSVGYSDLQIQEGMDAIKDTNAKKPKKLSNLKMLLLLGLIVLVVGILLLGIRLMSIQTASVPFYVADMQECAARNYTDPAEFDSCVSSYRKMINTTQDCKDLITGKELDGFAKRLCDILVKDEISLCDSIPESSFCRMAISVKSHDLASCQTISSEGFRSNCEKKISEQDYWCMVYGYMFYFD